VSCSRLVCLPASPTPASSTIHPLQIDENVQREIINHRSLRHPNIIRFKEVILTPTHLAIVMEYASGGELFERICNAGRFSEDEVHVFRLLSSTLLVARAVCLLYYCHSYLSCTNVVDYQLSKLLSGAFLFPATHIRGQLLPFHGTTTLYFLPFQYYYQI
jgi:hypothetical protein